MGSGRTTGPRDSRQGVIERHFGESAPLSLGVEEEVMILDAETLEPAAAVHVLLEGAAELELPGSLKTELHASVVELTTGICVDVEEAIAALRELRLAADGIARANGLVIAAAGSHPTALLESLPVVQEERYLQMLERVGRAARRQGVNGLHVHVGVDSAEHCYERLEAVLSWLPLVLALSANSPFADGEATGMLSNRAEILTQLPRAGAPPAFGSYDGFESWVERLMRIGVLEDYTRIWWDARPHPNLGTLEIRGAHRARRPRGGERDPDGPGHARMGRRPHDSRHAARGDGERGVPRDRRRVATRK